MFLNRRHKITVGFLVIYWVVLVLLEHISMPGIVYRAGLSDKWLHFLAYMNLAFLLWFSLLPQTRADWLKPAVWLLLLGMVTFGGIDELTQPYTGRTCDFYDFLSDALGALGGLVIAGLVTFWSSLLVVWAVTIFGAATLVRGDISKLAPVFDVCYHIAAYGGFTLVWDYFISLYILPRGITWKVFLAISAPVGLMFFVKVVSMFLGRYFTIMELACSAVAIVVTAAVSCLFGLTGKLKMK